jgi:hypothetical protein
MATTYDKIATTTLGSANSTITFSSISSAYTDLRLVFYINGTGSLPIIRFNNDATSLYSRTRIEGQGSSATSNRASSATSIPLFVGGAGVNSFHTVDVFSYAGGTNKTSLIGIYEDANGSGYVGLQVGLWRDTSAITRIDLIDISSTFAAGSTATLYGILKA